MKKLIMIAAIAGASPCIFAHSSDNATANQTRSISYRKANNMQDSIQQFLLIIRYKPNMSNISPEAMKTNGQHWGQFIGELAQSGKLVTGYRPGTEGKTISGNVKTTKNGVYAGDKEVVSSIFVIKAASLEEASAIAQKCPIYEMDGSVEIRPIINATN